MKIDGKSALVTGAAGGIGKATAIMLAGKGAATVVLADVDEPGLESTSAAVRAAGALPLVRVADLSSSESVVDLFAEADTATNGLDIVHNNAGVMAGGADFPDTDIERMIAVIQINLVAMMVGTRVAIEQMRKRAGGGVIINTASVAAFSPMPADPSYAASKAAVVSFTQSCKPLREAFDIRVMAVCPGIVDTAIVPHDAQWLKPALESLIMLQPEDIARAVCEIIGDDDQAGEFVIVQNEAAEK